MDKREQDDHGEVAPQNISASAPRGKKSDRKIGLLLINLGTPEATDYWSMRKYLKEFLSDPRVIETPRWLWWPLLNLIILTTRPKKSGEAYAQIWDRTSNESPLRRFTRSQAARLAQIFDLNGRRGGASNIEVDWAMRYGTPSIEAKLNSLVAQGCHRVLLFPLYPQYSASTSATVADAAFAALAKMRLQPTLRIVPPYYDEPTYIDALAHNVQASLKKLKWVPDHIVASFHGLPQSYADKGDPYPNHCQHTARLLRQRLGYKSGQLILTYQSRFGREEWLKPYTEDSIRELARAGVGSLAVITPGFASDCVETLEEIAIQNRDAFIEEGGKNFAVIPCLNDGDSGMIMLETIARRELSGWA